MFVEPHAVGEIPQWESESDTSTEPCVRHMGVGAFCGGAWALPSFSEEVPIQLGQGPLEAQYLARLSLTLHQKGFKLPADAGFTTFSEIIKNQLISGARARFKRSTGSDEQRLPFNVYVVHELDQIHVIGIPEQDLDVYQLSPVFYKLESVKAGLGWYLAHLLGSAITRGLSLYEPTRLGYLASYQWFMGCESNEDLFKEYSGEEAEFDIELLREECNVLPSDFIDDYGGNAELLYPRGSGKSTSPMIKYGHVRALLRQPGIADETRQIVEAMLRLQHVFRRRQWEKGQSWHSYENGENQIGALAVVVWEQPNLSLELIEHTEVDAYNSGDCEEELFRLSVSTADPKAFDKIANAINAYADRLSALNHLLGFLPKVYVE
jgi:PRTRC genetic system protein F